MVQIHQDSILCQKIMHSFRFKIFISYVVLLILFISMLVPFIQRSVQNLVLQSMDECADNLISKIEASTDERSLVRAIKDESYLMFYHVSLFDSNETLLFDSLNKRFQHVEMIEHTVTHKEVEEALLDGTSYRDGYSTLINQKLLYFAKSFSQNNKRYVLRLAFAQSYIQELKRQFTTGFVIFSIVLLLLFSVMTALVLYHFMGPVRQMIRAIKPYQEGKISFIPEIIIRSRLQDEFSDLASTLNALSKHIQQQINTLILERNEKETILQSLIEGVIAAQDDGSIMYANKLALEFLNLSENIIGKSLPAHLHAYSELLIRCQTEKRILNTEMIDERKKRHFNITASPYATNGAILVIQDKSIQYKILEMRKDFIANASHELKTPITVINGCAELLRDNRDLSTDKTTQLLDKIVNQSIHMTTTIKNLLTLADIEHLPAFRLQKSNLVEILLQCREIALQSYPGASITLEETSPLIVTLDRELISIAFMNILDNALKYSEGKPKVSISFQKTDGFVKIKIQDRGIGIPERDLDHIFTRFYTVNKTESKKLGGSGLGLSIVETIVEKHFGKVLVQSEVGSGSTFTIELPEKVLQEV